MAEDVRDMMMQKVEAIKRIMRMAENQSQEHNYDKDHQHNNTDAKNLTDLNTSSSSSDVQLPPGVDDADPLVRSAIDWSRKLDETFKDNVDRDPSLYRQFFASSTGFLRQFPSRQLARSDPRMQDWYTWAAASTKVGLYQRR